MSISIAIMVGTRIAKRSLLKVEVLVPKNFCNSSDFRIVVQLLYNSRIVGELMYTCCVGLECL